MFVWKIRDLEYIEEVNNLQKVIKNIHWWVEIHDGPNMGYNWGNVQLDIENIDNFISWESLTETQCITWVKNRMNQLFSDGYEGQEAAAAAMLATQDPIYRRGVGTPW